MSIRSCLVFIAICAAPLALAQDSDLKVTNPISVQVEKVARSEQISKLELEKAYIAYRAAYNYGHLLGFEGTEDFGELFDKMRLITNRLEYVRNQKLSDEAYSILKKYEDKPFEGNHKSEFLDDCYHISEGLVRAMN